MLQFHELFIRKLSFVKKKKKKICITLSASRAGHARQKFQKCEIMILLQQEAHSTRFVHVDVRCLSDLF